MLQSNNRDHWRQIRTSDESLFCYCDSRFAKHQTNVGCRSRTSLSRNPDSRYQFIFCYCDIRFVKTRFDVAVTKSGQERTLLSDVAIRLDVHHFGSEPFDHGHDFVSGIAALDQITTADDTITDDAGSRSFDGSVATAANRASPTTSDSGLPRFASSSQRQAAARSRPRARCRDFVSSVAERASFELGRLDADPDVLASPDRCPHFDYGRRRSRAFTQPWSG